MAGDRLLTTVLGLYQDVHDAQRTDQIFGSTVTLLTNLSNPLNVSLLTSQFLTAPAIWHRPDPLRTCFRVISIYNTAAIHVRRNELDNAARKGPPVGGGLSSEAWATAVAKGADERSARWQHVLVLTGVLMGLEGDDRQSLSYSMRRTVEQAVVTAANLALETHEREGPFAGAAIVLALNYAFPLLSEGSRAQINCDALLPISVRGLIGEDGFQDLRFLSQISKEVRQVGSKYNWPQDSSSYVHLRETGSRPLVEAAGPLSKLIAYSIERAKNAGPVLRAQDDIVTFTGSIFEQWRRAILSEIEESEEGLYLTPETLQSTWPALWQMFRRALFAVVAVMQSVVARSLLDPHLRNGSVASAVAAKTLHILRNLYFVSSRGNDGFQVYSFTYLTSIDILARNQEASTTFLRDTISATPGSIPAIPLLRILDLFYLNVAEHLPLNLPPDVCESLIVQPAAAYLTHYAPLSPRMIELFESAHSAVLSVLSCPGNGPIAVKVGPFYAETLLSSFPSYISARQFRLAFKTLMQILSPPFPISATNPELAETLLEMVRFRVPAAGKAPLPASPDAGVSESAKDEGPVSEQSALVLTLIDALPFLPLSIVEDWMTLTAMALNEITHPVMREVAKRRFWDVLVSGEMDVERAAIGVAWWGTKGGRDAVLFGSHQARQDNLVMSGAIVEEREMGRL